MAAPKYNINAEKWTLKEAMAFFEEALEMSNSIEYDFLGEIARDLKSYKNVFTYLTDKYPELKQIFSKITGNLEANCFGNAKKGKIKEATAIVNLKSNYNWTDKQQIEHTGKIITGIEYIVPNENNNKADS